MAEKVIVITGASSGIGASVAELVVRRGHSVVLVARRKEALEAVAARCAGKAHAVVADVTSRDEVKRVVGEALHAFGRVDVWVNNAGRGITRMPSQLSDEDVDDMMRVNVKSALYGMQEILPHFEQRGEGQIVNVSSMLGRIVSATMRSAYAAAKHYLNALTIAFRQEVQEKYPGIQFTLVSPGVVRTDFGRNAMHGGPDSHTLPYSQGVEEVAEVIADVIESRRPDVYTRKGAADMIAGYYARIGEDP